MLVSPQKERTKEMAHFPRWRLLHFISWNKNQSRRESPSSYSQRQHLSLCFVVCLTFLRKTQHLNKTSLNECIVDNSIVIILKCALKPCFSENSFSPSYLLSSKQAVHSTRTLFRRGFCSGDSAEGELRKMDIFECTPSYFS